MCEISIIIPVYNKRRYIADSVKTVLRQTFRDFELLLIDDGSTDGSGLICNRLSAIDSRVHVFHTDNRGVSAARNYGISKAVGKYISFIDADDFIDKTFLEKLHASIIKNDAELATCGYYEIREGKSSNKRIKKYTSDNNIYEILRQDLLCILWNKLFVREKIKHLFDESVSTCEDSVFCARYYFDNKPKIAYVNEALYGYNIHDNSLTTSFQTKAFEGIDKLLRINRKISEQIGNERFRYLAIHHVYKVYYYGIYMYIFGNISSGRIDREKLAVIHQIISDKKYQRIIRFILKCPLRDRRAEKNGILETLIIIASLLKMKRTILFLTKIRKCMGI